MLLGYGFGALAIVGWEAMEWLVSEDGIGGADGLALTYGDTIGDLVLSTTGGLLGSWIGVRRLGPVGAVAVDRCEGRDQSVDGAAATADAPS